jgi:hypothetical protein
MAAIDGLRREKQYEAAQKIARGTEKPYQVLTMLANADARQLILWAWIEGGFTKQIIALVESMSGAAHTYDTGWLSHEQVFEDAWSFISDTTEGESEEFFTRLHFALVLDKIKFWAGLREANSGEKATAFINWILSIDGLGKQLEGDMTEIEAKYDKKLTKLQSTLADLETKLAELPAKAKAKSTKKK